MALEELDTEVNPAPVEVAAEVTDFVEAPENDLADAAVAEGEAQADIEAIDEAADTAETLEAVGDQMEASVAEGGMSEPEARALEVAVEHLRTRVGFSNKRKVFPAMEGFKDKTTRIEKTKIAMEAIKEDVAKIWAQIKAFLLGVWEKFKAFFKSLADGAIRLKARAEALAKKAAATKDGHGPDGKKIKTGSFGKMLTVDGKFVTDKALVTAYAKNAADPVINADRAGLVSKVEPILKEMMTADAEKAKALMGDAVAILSAAFENVSGGKDSDLSTHDLVFGNQQFAYSTTGGGKSYLKTKEGELSVPDEVEALEADVAGKLADAVAKHMSTYANSATKIGEGINKLNSLVNSLKSTKSDGPGAAKAAANIVRQANCAVVQATAVLKGYDVKVGKAALDYVGASLGGLKQEKAEPAAA